MGMVANVGFVVLAFIVMFGLKIIGGQLIMLEEGYGQTTANQEIINNSGLPTLVLFLFAVFFAPVLEELLFRGFLWGEYLVRIRLWDYCYQVFVWTYSQSDQYRILGCLRRYGPGPGTRLSYFWQIYQCTYSTQSE